MTTSSTQSVPFRPEIQGLRALAVLSVMVFHIWPVALPGGYVGVDVFFVISGYLITDLLLRELAANGRISIASFYERRIRRLLPAATLVLVVVAALSLLLPIPRWPDTAAQIAASALYVENWWLAGQAVDYMAQETAASPVQHFWSLSVEGQFYLVWPLVFIVAAAVATRFRQSAQHLIVWVIGLVTVASLAVSISYTAAEPAPAYFATFTRVWELGAGGLLAAIPLPAIGSRAAEWIRIAGLAAIAASFALFSSDTPFPGSAALLPVLGTVAVMAAGTSGSAFAMWALGLRPVQYLGAISYSAYLWHWPLVVLAEHYRWRSPSVLQGLILIAASLGLAALTKRFVEDRFRGTRGMPGWRTIGAVSVALSICLVSAAVLNGLVASSPAAPYFASINEASVTLKGDDCHLDLSEREIRPCFLGSSDSPKRILLAGDSHAGNWVPAFEEIAWARGWRIELATKSSCPLLIKELGGNGSAYDACLDWGRQVLDRVRADPPDLLVLAMRSRDRALVDGTPFAQAIAKTWDEIDRLGVRMVVIADTPEQRQAPMECVLEDVNCATSTDVAMSGDKLAEARSLRPEIDYIDMNDAFCWQGRCPVIINGIFAWRDTHHFTSAYSRSLAPLLADRLAPYLD